MRGAAPALTFLAAGKIELIRPVPERPAFAKTNEPLSHDCRSHGPISPMDGCAALAGDISEVDAGVALSFTPGIDIPDMSMPPMSILAIASEEPADAVVDSLA